MNVLGNKPAELLHAIRNMYPEAPGLPAGVKLQMHDYQMVMLFGLAQKVAREHNWKTATVVEIGCGFGGSTIFLCKAVHPMKVVTYTTSAAEAEIARSNLKRFGCEADVVVGASWDHLKDWKQELAMVFVDGDHNAIRRDMPFFNKLQWGGLFFCHDYSSNAGNRVVAEMDVFAAKLGRRFDELCVDADGTGMVGFYRQKGNRWTL